MTLKIRVHGVNFIVNYGVDKSTCLTTQEHLQHAWDITLQHPGQLGYHTNTVHKYNLSMLLTKVPCLSTSTSYPGSKLPALLDHIFAGYIFLCLIDPMASLLGFHQVPLDPGQIELLQTFCEDDSYDNPIMRSACS